MKVVVEALETVFVNGQNLIKKLLELQKKALQRELA